MGIDFFSSRNLRSRLERFRERMALVLLRFLHRVIVKLGSRNQKERFTAEWEAHEQVIGEKWRSVHRQALFANVGLAISQWAGIEELLVAIAGLLLRTYEAQKVGTILYSITNFYTWLSIISDLFLLEPLYIYLIQRWNKLSGRLKDLNDTRVRLAHHTVYYGGNATTLASEISLRPGQFDVRPKSQKHRSAPLDYDQLCNFIEITGKVISDLKEVLNAMTEITKRETSQQNSSKPISDPPRP